MTSPDRDQQLTHNMGVLERGLEQIAATYGEHVVVVDEDPLTFGAGHFVLYPIGDTLSRFAIEEQYTGTDWSDDDRLPTSWTWCSDRIHGRGDGSYPWETLADGEVSSDNVGLLLARAEAWAQLTHNLAARAKAIALDPAARTRDRPPPRSPER